MISLRKRIGAFFLGFLVTGVLVVVLGLILGITTSPDRYTVLVVGSDQRGTERARSDVLFVVSIPKRADEQPVFLTIPRDTKIEDDEYGLQKITHFYALGERRDDDTQLGNIDLTRGAVEQLLGIRVDGTAEVTFASFESLVDDLGGAVIDGAAVTGAEALAAVRDRFTEGRSDFDRQADGREVVRSLFTKVRTPSAAQDLLGFFDDSSQARLEFNKLKAVHFLIGAGIARRGDISIGEMKEEVVPGAGGRIYTPDFGKELYYWIPDEEALQVIVEESLK